MWATHNVVPSLTPRSSSHREKKHRSSGVAPCSSKSSFSYGHCLCTRTRSQHKLINVSHACDPCRAQPILIFLVRPPEGRCPLIWSAVGRGVRATDDSAPVSGRVRLISHHLHMLPIKTRRVGTGLAESTHLVTLSTSVDKNLKHMQRGAGGEDRQQGEESKEEQQPCLQ
ncbi:unnamed protein product [Pleuronectes platessa]|uniref:Uncharacterized protein n=1 Tax=Pleuronectes platessa TaxID=8262 RepID=A0A9N7UJ62_PLEPL|nr:unnamed protein product [Pleuronectes platessa]